jgi:heme-binding protein
MKSTAIGLRRGLLAAFVATAAAGAALTGPSATAAPDPCAASQVAKTIGTVANDTGEYLDAHPQTNAALTTVSQSQGGPQSLAALKSYFDANPEVAADMQELQRPLTNLSGRCKLPVTLPQVMGLMQAAQSQTATSPATLPGAQTPRVPASPVPAQSSPVSAATQGTGPLPGPYR